MSLRQMGMISALFTLIAICFGVFSLTTFGYNAWDIIVILVPMAIGVAAFLVGLTYLSAWMARRLHHDDNEEQTENSHVNKAQE